MFVRLKGKDVPITYIKDKPYVTRDHFHFSPVINGKVEGWADPALPSLPSIGNKTANLRLFSNDDERVEEFRKTMRRDVNELKPFIKKSGTKNAFVLDDLASRRYSVKGSDETTGRGIRDLFYDKELGEGKAVIVKMSPEKYLKLATPIIRDEKSIEFQKKRLREGSPIGIPALTTEATESIFSDGEFKKSKNQQVINHEGRHRATASKELGIKEIPVIITRNPSQNRFTDEDIKNIKSGHLLRQER